MKVTFETAVTKDQLGVAIEDLELVLDIATPSYCLEYIEPALKILKEFYLNM